MEGQICEVVISDLALISLGQIYEYGIETFPFTAATVFIEELILRIEQLSTDHHLHPERRYLINFRQILCPQIFAG